MEVNKEVLVGGKEMREATAINTLVPQQAIADPVGSQVWLRWLPVTIVTISEGEDAEPKVANQQPLSK